MAPDAPGNPVAPGGSRDDTGRMDAHGPVVTDLVTRVRVDAPGEPLGLYLTGSAVHGGLRPDSDVDLLLVTRRSLDAAERRALVDHLLRVSGRRATQGPGRPVELTSLVLHDVVPWRYPATCDFLYGEWLRDDYLDGALPQPIPDANLPVTLTAARTHAVALLGPPVGDLLAPVPDGDVATSLLDALPALLADLRGDERNVLLTLARMVHTLDTGLVVPKDVAARVVAPTLPAAQAPLLELAARAYRGEAQDDWSGIRDDAAHLAATLAARVRALGP